MRRRSLMLIGLGAVLVVLVGSALAAAPTITGGTLGPTNSWQTRCPQRWCDAEVKCREHRRRGCPLRLSTWQ